MKNIQIWVMLWQAIKMAFLMAWEISWALILGFVLSAVIQVLVPKQQMSKLLPDSSLKSLLIACGLGAASSSCSYAAVAITRAMIRKGANFVSAMAFQMASTNLVIELGILIIILLGWKFTLAEVMGGFILVVIMAFLFRWFVADSSIDKATEQAARSFSGKMEGHAHDMSEMEGSFSSQWFSNKSFTAISHYFVMDWISIWKDIVLGLLIAGALAAWVPHSFWAHFFLKSHPFIAKLWGPLIGPLVAIFSFVCSVGNVPLAAVLWNGGISFGGILSFIFADLLVIPILHIYFKYYGLKMAVIIFIIYYVAIVAASLLLELVFDFFRVIPTQRAASITTASLQFNYTTLLNIILGLLAFVLVHRFYKTDGIRMIKMMHHPCHKD